MRLDLNIHTILYKNFYSILIFLIIKRALDAVSNCMKIVNKILKKRQQLALIAYNLDRRLFWKKVFGRRMIIQEILEKFIMD